MKYMQLRNKETGEIKEFGLFVTRSNVKNITLTKLNEEWEDYEEPKGYWSYDTFNNDVTFNSIANEDNRKADQEIGNYFETKEEAELAARKLKAWKRLKDKGFKFTGIAGISNNIHVSFETDNKYNGGHIMYDKYSNSDNKLREYNEDLNLLFGGEE